MKGWQDYYAEKQRRRRRRCLMACGLIIVLILLGLFQCQESRSPLVSNFPGRGTARTPLNERFLVFVPERRKFENDQKIAAPWARDLYNALSRRESRLRACFQGHPSYSFDWWFSYQPSTGRFLHRAFRWHEEHEPGQQILQCIESILEENHRTSLANPRDASWFFLSIRYSDDVGRFSRESGLPIER